MAESVTPQTRRRDEPATHRCIERGCDQPAGTPWSGYWCSRHDALRLDRIGRQLDGIVTEMAR